jgi:hypothetical protein
LFLKTLPRLLQSVPGEDVLKSHEIEHAGFDKLEQASFVFGATGLEGNGGQMFIGSLSRH